MTPNSCLSLCYWRHENPLGIRCTERATVFQGSPHYDEILKIYRENKKLKLVLMEGE
jgi:hypothetical protein